MRDILLSDPSLSEPINPSTTPTTCMEKGFPSIFQSNWEAILQRLVDKELIISPEDHSFLDQHGFDGLRKRVPLTIGNALAKFRSSLGAFKATEGLCFSSHCYLLFFVAHLFLVDFLFIDALFLFTFHIYLSLLFQF